MAIRRGRTSALPMAMGRADHRIGDLDWFRMCHVPTRFRKQSPAYGDQGPGRRGSRRSPVAFAVLAIESDGPGQSLPQIDGWSPAKGCAQLCVVNVHRPDVDRLSLLRERHQPVAP